MKFTLLTLLALSVQQSNSTIGLLSHLFNWKLGLLGLHHGYGYQAAAPPAPIYIEEPENIRERARDRDYNYDENDNQDQYGYRDRNINTNKNSGDNSGNINIVISNNGDNKDGILAKGYDAYGENARGLRLGTYENPIRN